jgi:hypothetical protein
MKALTKYLAGAAAAAAITVTAASPAQAQIFGGDRYDRDGIDAGDIITGVAVVGGIAAILGAFGRDGNRYGYDNRYRYRDDYTQAVNACGYQAERYGQGGRISVTDVDRRGSNSYRVRGVIDAGYASNGYGSYGRYDTRASRYDTRSGRYDPRYDRADRYGNYGRYDQRIEFACTARSNGRVTDFDIDRRY